MNVKDALPFIRTQMSRLRIPSQQDKIYKDECIYSFDSPYSDTGLYVNLINFHGCGRAYLMNDAQKSNSRLYLFEQWQQIPKETVSDEHQEISKLAIGVEGGFNTQPKYDIIKEHSLVILNEAKTDIQLTIPLPNNELPEFISNICNEIIKHEGMRSNLDVLAWEADNELKVSKYAQDLPQLNPQNKKIPQDPKLWKDEASDATENLWLNLSTGYIGGGRQVWDGSGGSGSALQHYIDTGRKYPLVVKLGTITPHGADVWSYSEDEDNLVLDPHLANHLSFWGIDVMKMEKTDKSLNEMQVKLNQTYDWMKIVEKNEKLEPVTGPGFIGLRNIGSSCYMNSLLQCLFAIPEVRNRLFLSFSRFKMYFYFIYFLYSLH
jgi:ubiquitin carboxyl-terminal hydrolase 5/13